MEYSSTIRMGGKPWANSLAYPVQSISMLYDVDKCNECDEGLIEESCNKCGEGVCLSNTCCELFPHYHNSNYTICRQCTISIEKKLYVLVNYSELRLLKQKISKRMEKKAKQLGNK